MNRLQTCGLLATAAAALLVVDASAFDATLLFQDTFDDMSHLSVGSLDSGRATYGIVPSPAGKEGNSLKGSFDGSEGADWVHRTHDLGGTLPTSGIVTYSWNFMLNGVFDECKMGFSSDPNAYSPMPFAIAESRGAYKLGTLANDDWDIHPGSTDAWGPPALGEWHTAKMVVDLDRTTDNVQVYLSQGLDAYTDDHWYTASVDTATNPLTKWQHYKYAYGANGPWDVYIDDLAVYSGAAITDPPPPEPPQIGLNRQLFVDDAIIANTSNVDFTLHQPAKHQVGGVTTPVLKADQPWEVGSVAVYGTTIYDEQDEIYKMWYRSIEGDCYICYATSTDGVNWDKPSLGVSPYNGSTENNICHGFENFYTDGFGVIKDLDDPDPNRRYKLLTYKGSDRFAAMVSPDGVNWSGPVNPQIHHTGDVISMYYDEGLDKYVGLTKRYIDGKRSRLITFSDDFENWTSPRVILTPDGEDTPTTHIYSHVGYEYEDMRIGYIAVYDTATELMDTQLVYSRDGINWHRYRDRDSFIPLGQVGDCDSGIVIAGCSGLVSNDEKISIYYTGWNVDHDGNAIGGGDPIFGIGLAELRKDGFVSVDAGTDGGTLTTIPFVLPDGQLMINAATSPAGSIRAELLDAQGQIIDGYASADSIAFSGDSLTARMLWSGGSIDESLLGETVSLKFYIQDAGLYSFWLTAPPTPGDANGDGYVNVTDLGILATNYGAGGTFTWDDGDFDGDTVVNVTDLGILATWYGTVPNANSVPEPSTLANLLALSLSILLPAVRRKTAP